jgi:hypothetical protein
MIELFFAKALYGTLQAAMLFWKDLTVYLATLGFVLNPYDNCVANKTIDGTQCTILWHVDNLKITHAKQEVLKDLVTTLNACCGKLDPLTITQGDIHDYLGMTLDYSVPGQVSIRMDDYVWDLLDKAPIDMDGLLQCRQQTIFLLTTRALNTLTTQGPSFSSYDGQTVICLQTCTTQYTDCSGFPHDTCQAARQR